jgi:hypothetical protein
MAVVVNDRLTRSRAILTGARLTGARSAPLRDGTVRTVDRLVQLPMPNPASARLPVLSRVRLFIRGESYFTVSR